MINYSIIIPTHNRHNLMQKNIEYFSLFENSKIYICDSTDANYNGKFPQNMTYVHMPQKSFVQKMSLILEKVKTPYVAVCADDDFLIKETVENMVDILSSKSFHLGIGKYLGFNVGTAKVFKIYNDRELPINLSFENKYNQASYMSQHYYMSLWGVYRVEMLKKAYGMFSAKHVFHEDLIEIILLAYFSSYGRIYTSQEFLGVREVGNLSSWGNTFRRLYKCEDDEIGREIDKALSEKGETALIKFVWSFVHAERERSRKKFFSLYDYITLSSHVLEPFIYKYYKNKLLNKNSNTSLKTFDNIEVNEEQAKLDYLRFFYLKISELDKKKVYLIYGAGSVGKIVFSLLGKSVVGFVDKKAHEMQYVNNIPIYNLCDLKTIKFDYIIITTLSSKAIENTLIKSAVATKMQIIHL